MGRRREVLGRSARVQFNALHCVIHLLCAACFGSCWLDCGQRLYDPWRTVLLALLIHSISISLDIWSLSMSAPATQPQPSSLVQVSEAHAEQAYSSTERVHQDVEPNRHWDKYESNTTKQC